MVAVEGRLFDMVVSRLHPAGEGDILVPQRRLTVAGTSLWLADHPDRVRTPRDHARRVIDLGAALAPSLRDAKVHAVWSASRPLVDDPSSHDAPQAISRTFTCFDHGALHGRPGLISIIGGKATTLRAMAEAAADLACAALGRSERRCTTMDEVLPPPRAFFRHAGAGGRP
jgi:glycerol-3-phosphate dehydrogenase